MSRYSCYTLDPTKVRGRTTVLALQDGWVTVALNGKVVRLPIEVLQTTHWLPMKCGRLDQLNHTDYDCIGCAFDKERKGCRS